MITVISYILNLFAPLINFLGILGLFGCIIYDDLHILPFVGLLAVIGLIFGIFAYRLDIPPRQTWSKSANELLEFDITIVLGYAWNFAMWPCAIYVIKALIETISQL